MTVNERGLAGTGAALIVNAQAREGERALADARRLLEAHGLRVGAAWASEQPERLGDLIRRARSAGRNPIVVGGGDGSISTAAGILANCDCTLGVLPLGTANDFARTLAIPTDLEGACAVIARGETVAVDLGTCGDRFYLNLASIGLAGDVATMLPHWLKRLAGKLAYPLATVSAIRRFDPFDITLTFPEGGEPPVTLRHVIQFGVGNGHFYGGGMAVAPDASLESGHLDIYAIKLQRWKQMLAVGKGLRSGTHIYRQGVYYTRARRVSVAVSRPLPVDIDGELVMETPRSFSVARDALYVLAQPGHAAGSESR